MGSQAASTSSVMPWSRSPAAAAVSMTRAATSGSTCSSAAVVRSSRTPRPPALSAAGGWVPHRSRSSSVRRTSSNAAPAAARSTSACARSEVAGSGGVSIRRPAAASSSRRTDQGSRTCRSSTCTSRPCATRSAVGPAAPLHRPSARVSARWSRIVRAGGSRRSSRPGTSSAGGPSGSRSTSRTTRTGRSGEPQTRARVRSRPSARSTASALTPERGGVGVLHDRLEHRELEGVQPVERTQHRRLHHHPGRELRGVVRCGRGQVGARVEQRGQLLLRPAAQLVGERARGRRGHPANSTQAFAARV